MPKILGISRMERTTLTYARTYLEHCAHSMQCTHLPVNQSDLTMLHYTQRFLRVFL